MQTGVVAKYARWKLEGPRRILASSLFNADLVLEYRIETAAHGSKLASWASKMLGSQTGKLLVTPQAVQPIGNLSSRQQATQQTKYLATREVLPVSAAGKSRSSHWPSALRLTHVFVRVLLKRVAVVPAAWRTSVVHKRRGSGDPDKYICWVVGGRESSANKPGRASAKDRPGGRAICTSPSASFLPPPPPPQPRCRDFTALGQHLRPTRISSSRHSTAAASFPPLTAAPPPPPSDSNTRGHFSTIALVRTTHTARLPLLESDNERAHFTAEFALVNCSVSNIAIGANRWGRGGVVVRLLVSHLSEPLSIPGGIATGVSPVRIMLDDAAGRRVFAGISRFFQSTRFTLIDSQDLDVKSRLNISTNESIVSTTTPTAILRATLVYCNCPTLRSIRRLMKYDELRRSPQQASCDVYLGRRHVEKDLFCSSALPPYRPGITQPVLIPWLVEEIPAYRGSVNASPDCGNWLSSSPLISNGVFGQAVELRPVHAIVTVTGHCIMPCLIVSAASRFPSPRRRLGFRVARCTDLPCREHPKKTQLVSSLDKQVDKNFVAYCIRCGCENLCAI
ncbi:hypothetical protein PR048_021285 [Dryococelus australis]|uniref:Uncharacterized protein n=1 Tax=Dryococelus australis TaxID=614101 RepID=A0ABQ9GXR9_9NEOP|nr:hypothetical protein PR048_021285 [Dryococelus australis]